MKSLKLAAALLAAIALPLSIAQPGTAVAAEAKFQPTRFSVEVVGEGPDLLLIPGLSSVPAVYAGQIDMLSKSHRVHRLTVAGFDGSDAGPNGEGDVLPHLVDEIAAYIATLPGGRAAVVGHSMGGFTGLNLLLDHPERVERLMIVDSLPFYSVVMDPNATADGMKSTAAMMRTQIASQKRIAPGEDDCTKPSLMMRWMVIDDEAMCLIMRQTATADVRVTAQLFYEIATSDVRARLAEIRTPVTMLYPVDPKIHSGEAMDAFYAAQYAGLEGIDLVRIDDARHFIMYDQPGRFAEELARFLAN